MIEPNITMASMTPRTCVSISPTSGRPSKYDTESSARGRDCCLYFQSRVVIRRKNVCRQCFEVLVALSLLYIGSIFPFRLCFLEFHIPDPVGEEGGFVVIDTLIDAVFLVDLVGNFFFSFTDSQGNEVTNLRAIARNYVQGFFFVNLIACIPAQLITLILGGEDAGAGSAFNKSLRLGRLGQMSRLIKLTRILKLAASVSKSRLHRKLVQTRSVVFFNFAVGLFWVVHILACGWYLCAALHSDPSHTWVARRSILSEDDDATLLDASPGEQWLHAMYFVLTVFTTVGFGDMHAVTSWEILYASVTMMVGALVHSIAVSEMINIVMKKDQETLERGHQVELVDGFARHTQLEKSTARIFQRWANNNTATRCAYDREQMGSLLTSNLVPRSILEQLPGAMFGGELRRNKFITHCFQGPAQLPPRFPAVVALMLNHHSYEAKEFVYQSFDQSWNLFLVCEGTFANVGKPGRRGGSCPAASLDVNDADLMYRLESSSQPGSGPPGFDHHPTLLTQTQAQQTLFTRIKTHVFVKDVTPTVRHNSSLGLYPYQLFGHSTYFGDSELFENVERRSSVRCESSSGSLLGLHKKDFMRLMEDFPSFTRIWMVSAKQREARRKVLLSRLTVGHKYKHLAASAIQRYFRMLAKKTPTPVTSPSMAHDAISIPSSYEIAAPRSIRTEAARLDAREVGAVEGEESAVTALRADVDTLRAEVRDGFKQLQQCLQAVMTRT